MTEYTIIDPHLVLDLSEHSLPIAGFDIDYTLIKPKSGRKFPIDKDDWKYLFSEEIIKKKLREISSSHQIVFFTNQKKFNSDLEEKFRNLISDFDLPICIFVSLKSGYYRKPFTGLWDLLSGKFNLDTTKSFYCGDAAGRETDFAATDKMFANNIGIPFYTPEEYFLDQNTTKDVTNLHNCLTNYLDSELKHKTLLNQIQDSLEPFTNEKTLIILVGYPGSGKSHVANLLNKTYQHQIVSRDKLKTKAKCQKLIKQLVKEGKNIVVDATNYSKEMRQESIESVSDENYRVIVIKITNSIESSFFMNQYRCQTTKGLTKLIPKVAYYRIRKKLTSEPLDIEEGIDVICYVTNYLPNNCTRYMFEGI